ncbi:uncharacterized protein E5676_scaffold325G00830 [Cucumis melo var. makuwa]|uniref:Senescence-specific cysteine protease sag39 n=2 Tax=Cucumis melo TaxID=3656 RepID=A0A5A7V9C8_CUCMM|nr:uncharacterized protein E6C27_scaffold130G00790 [Cucumis melo var. makuwa]TYK27399.1 uncharacterized protein E5676_scaffold325G00830 [Cucumis melo var. makuwa]
MLVIRASPQYCRMLPHKKQTQHGKFYYIVFSWNNANERTSTFGMPPSSIEHVESCTNWRTATGTMLKLCGSSHLSPLERRLARRKGEEATHATIQGKRRNSPEIEVADARGCDAVVTPSKKKGTSFVRGLRRRWLSSTIQFIEELAPLPKLFRLGVESLKYVDDESIGQGPERPTGRAGRANALPRDVPDSIRFLESRLEEISEKSVTIDALADRVKGLSIQELLARVDTLEGKVGRTSSHKLRDSLTSFIAHIEECVLELDSSQKTLLEMINGMLEDFQATVDVVRNEIVDVKTRLNLTMRTMANQALTGGAIPVSRVKISEPKPFCEARDVKTLENYIFNIEQYFRAMNTVIKKDKVTLATMHLSEDAKLWWRSWYVDIQEGHCTIDI